MQVLTNHEPIKINVISTYCPRCLWGRGSRTDTTKFAKSWLFPEQHVLITLDECPVCHNKQLEIWYVDSNNYATASVPIPLPIGSFKHLQRILNNVPNTTNIGTWNMLGQVIVSTTTEYLYKYLDETRNYRISKEANENIKKYINSLGKQIHVSHTFYFKDIKQYIPAHILQVLQQLSNLLLQIPFPKTEKAYNMYVALKYFFTEYIYIT